MQINLLQQKKLMEDLVKILIQKSYTATSERGGGMTMLLYQKMKSQLEVGIPDFLLLEGFRLCFQKMNEWLPSSGRISSTTFAIRKSQ